MVRRTHTERAAASLIEVLVVVGIIGILLSLLIPAVQQVRDAAARVACQNNLRQIGLALHHYCGIHRQFPPRSVPSSATHDPNNRLSWMALVLPQMDQGSLYEVSVTACRLETDVMKNPPHLGFATVVPSYVCPTDGRLSVPLTDVFKVTAAYTSYIGIYGAFLKDSGTVEQGALGLWGGGTLNAISDGLSNTILVGERPPPDSLQAGWWYPGFWGHGQGVRGPNNGIVLAGPKVFFNDGCEQVKGTFGPGRTDNPCDRFHLWSLHTGGANFLFADGGVKFLTYASEPIIIPLATRGGGEIVEMPF
jgi:prepilin-type processing-associated H-X9-DG protein